MFEVEQKNLLEKEISKQIYDFSWKCRRTGPESLAKEFLSENRAREQIQLLKNLAACPLRGAKVLEIGCGYGMFLLGLRLWEGAQAFGVEPGSDQYINLKIARDIMKMGGLSGNSLICSNGENLPFSTNSFEIIYSSNVLEHVENPMAVLKEAFRILQPGGRMIFIVPNYLSVWEGHYRLPWLPFFNCRPIDQTPLFSPFLEFIFYIHLWQHDDLGCWWSIAQAGMRPLGIVMDSPPFDYDPSLRQSIEYFPI